MIFTSFEFGIFFLLVLLGRALLRSLTAEKWFLLSASCAFYMTWSTPCVFLLLFMSVSDYTLARKMARTSSPVTRRLLLLTSLGINLGLLGFFKYSNFFLGIASELLHAVGWQIGPWHLDTVLPPGISYFTFAGLTYMLVSYYERIPVCASLLDYSLFVTFFPKLLSGPIVRARELLPQFRAKRWGGVADIEEGLAYILIGAVKKLVIADRISGHVNLIFASPGQFDRFTLLQGVVGYALQLYCDFSGYSDIAIGCARILGNQFPENFQMPFSALSITEFWRRWHITLSKWFRDYAFLPLEVATRRNPYPALRVSANILVVFLLVGLWHGASWNFVIFGGIHGLALVIHKLWTIWNPLRVIQKHSVIGLAWVVCARMLTFAVVLLSFVFFRSESLSGAGRYLAGLLSGTNQATRMVSPYILGALAGVVLVHALVNKDRNLAEENLQ